jgi:hypothetical protein
VLNANALENNDIKWTLIQNVIFVDIELKIVAVVLKIIGKRDVIHADIELRIVVVIEKRDVILVDEEGGIAVVREDVVTGSVNAMNVGGINVVDVI